MTDAMIAVGMMLVGGAVLARIIHLDRRDSVAHAVTIERNRIVAYLRRQAEIAEIVSSCRYLSAHSRAQESYASAVLEETASEIALGEHEARS